jgi:hypothetical protein
VAALRQGPADRDAGSAGYIENAVEEGHLMKILTRKLLILTVAGGASLTAAWAEPGDNFNRATLGAAWTSNSGTLSISGDELVGTTLAIGTFHPGVDESAASEVVFLNGGTAVQYGAIALGSNIAGGGNAFVKIQEQNGGGTFDHGAFYTGNNSYTGHNSRSVFFALKTPLPTSPAVLDVFFCGTTAMIRITSSTGVQTYSHDYGQTFGNGVGVGTYGPIGLDNFVANPSSCSDEPAPTPATSLPASMRADRDKTQ